MGKVFILTIDGWWHCAKKYKRYIFGVLGTIVLAAIILVIKPKTHKESNIMGDTDFIEQAIQLYEDSTGRKIYPKGRQCIRVKATERGYKTIDEVTKLLKENEKFM